MKPPRMNDRVRCRDTGDAGRVIEVKDGTPTVRFDNGAVGPCKSWEPLIKFVDEQKKGA